MKNSKPNIILVNCDDLGYGDIGCYGSPVNKTPYLDQMSEEGVRFTDFHVMSPVCSASRAGMMTGCYPQRINFPGVLFPGDPKGLHPDEITIADVLKEQGYSTKIVGKWHCGDQPEFLPTNHGFDEYYGIPYSNDMGLQGKRENIAKRIPLPLMKDDEILQEQPDQRGLTERYAEECTRFMRNNASTGSAQAKPFFLYLAHMYVHVPLFVPPRFLRQAANGPYGGAVECIDWVMGVLFHELEQLGIDENTMVIFMSDNGSSTGHGGSNDPLRGKKFTTWEGGQRVPFIVRWPAEIQAGRTCDETVSSMDFMPTFAKLAGTTEPKDRKIDGKDITPLLLGEDGAESPYESFYYYRCHSLDAVRMGKWKLRFAEGPGFNVSEPIPVELYDLDADIGETTNIAAEHPEIVEKLLAEADKARAELGDDVTETEGSGCRPVGFVENPVPLTRYDEDHPYIVAFYDTPDTKLMGGVPNERN